MTIRIINIGQTPNDKSGDPLRVAFDKVNQNFTELYNNLGIDGTIFDPLNVDSHIIPASNNTYDIGSPSKQWRSMYVGLNTLYINNVPISLDGNGRLTVDGDPIIVEGDLNNIVSIAFSDSSVQTTAYRYSAQPTAPTITSGALWFNTTDGRLYVNFNDTWVDSSPTEIDPSAIRFNQQNQIELPEGGDIVDSLGNSVLGSGGFTLPPNTTFDDFYEDGGATIYNSGGKIQLYSLVGEGNDGVNIRVKGDGGDSTWEFKSDGKLTLPNNTTISNALAAEYSSSFLCLQYGITDQTSGYFSSNSITRPIFNPLIATIAVGWFVSGPGLNGIKEITEIVEMGDGDRAFIVDLTDGSLWADLSIEIPYRFYSPDYALVYNGTRITVNSNEWNFTQSGNLTIPGDIHEKAGNNLEIAVHNNRNNDGTPGSAVLSLTNNDAVDSQTYTTLEVGGYSIKLNTDYTGVFTSTRRTWEFKRDGKLQLPVDGDIVDSTGTTVFKTSLSQFTNDLEIDANSLTGTTLSNNITGSSLTSVGTLTGLTSTGIVHITNTEDSTNADTGSLQVDGGAHITKNLIAEGTIYAGKDAYSEVLTNPLIVASSPSGVSGGYSQVAILNNTAGASGDFQVMVDGYDINGPAGDTGWADLGMAGSNFSDPRYSITNPGDGYVFVSGSEGSTNGGSLVLATDGSGINNDIVFATGGFTANKERMRLSNADNTFYVGNNSQPVNFEVKGAIGLNGQITLANGEVIDSQPQQVSIYKNDGITRSDVVLEPSAASIGTAKTGDSRYTRVIASHANVIVRTRDLGGVIKNWSFNNTGTLQLPVGGDIVNSSGVSVLSGAYTLPTASTSTLGGVKVDGSTIIIDGNGVISSTVVGAVTLKGTWDASTNTPTLSNSLPAGVALGWQYLVSVTGTRDIGAGSQTYTAGDIVMYDGVNWVDIPGAAGSVASFNNRTGAVTLTSGDVTTALGFTPYNSTNPSNFITSSALSGYATESYVTSQGYITSSGNAATATKLASSITINGVAFDGSGNITVTAAAGTLTGNTLNAGVTGSSLTSVGTLTNLTVTNPIAGSVTGSAGSVSGANITGTTLASNVVSSSLTSVGTLANLTVTNPIVGTVQNGVVTTGTYANPAWITSLAGSKVTNAVLTTDTGTVTNTMLANSSITINGSSVSLGGSTTITASADANTLTGTTLASGVVNSSLTSVGTLTSLTTSGTLTRSGNVSAAAWTTNGVGFKLPAATYTDTSSTGTVNSNYVHTIGIPTLASTSATTVNGSATLYIAGDPIAGSNTTLTASGAYSLYVGGKGYFGGALRVGSITSTSGAANFTLGNNGPTLNGVANVTQYLTQTALPAFRVYGSGSTTITVNTVLTSTHFTLDYQQGGTNLVVSTGIFTAPVAGLYQINIVGRAYSNAGVASQLAVVKNPSGTSSVMCMIEWAANTTVNHMGAGTVAKLAVGDTLVAKVLLGSVQFDANDSWSVAFLG